MSRIVTKDEIIIITMFCGYTLLKQGEGVQAESRAAEGPEVIVSSAMQA